jgi:hypothetical protein
MTQSVALYLRVLGHAACCSLVQPAAAAAGVRVLGHMHVELLCSPELPPHLAEAKQNAAAKQRSAASAKQQKLQQRTKQQYTSRADVEPSSIAGTSLPPSTAAAAAAAGGSSSDQGRPMATMQNVPDVSAAEAADLSVPMVSPHPAYQSAWHNLCTRSRTCLQAAA